MKQTLLSLCLLASISIYAQDPVVENAIFDEIPKNSGSDCACAHWMNKDLGDQAETSNTGLEDGNFAVKFDNLESDVVYQEVEVLANTDYKLTFSARLNDDSDDVNPPSNLEIRILKGSGYEIIYYDDATVKPSSGFGYTDIAEVELEANNIESIELAYPGNQDFSLYELNFNSGDETSIAIFARGIGRPDTRHVDENCDENDEGSRCFEWSAGKDETRLDYVELVNQSALSTQEVSASNLKVYPNPTHSILNIKSMDNVQIDNVELFSILGTSVFKTSSLTNDTIDVSELASGVYLLKINSGINSVTKRIVIE